MLGKRNLDTGEVVDPSWNRSRRVQAVKYPKVVDEERIERFDKSARLPSGPGINHHVAREPGQVQEADKALRTARSLHQQNPSVS